MNPRRVTDWRVKYNVVDPSRTEVIGASLWDRQTYTSAATTRIVYFSTVPANKRQGNLTIAGQLAAGTAFLIQAIRIVAFVPPAAIAAPAGAVNPETGLFNDLFNLYTNAVLGIDILNKRYAEYPGYMLPPAAGWSGASVNAGAAGSLSEVAAWGAPDPRAVYSLAVPIVIPPQTNFTTVVEWPAGAVTLIANVDIAVVLDGQLARPVQ